MTTTDDTNRIIYWICEEDGETREFKTRNEAFDFLDEEHE